VIVIHDATELDYSTLESLATRLGQIGKGTRRGYICHNVLAVDANTGEVLGMLDQVLHCRDKVPSGETRKECRDRKTRESLLWLQGTEELPADCRFIDIADQGACTFEFLAHEFNSGRRFVLRNAKTRMVYGGHQPSGSTQELQAYVRSLRELSAFVMDVQPQKGRSARKQAKFAVHGGPVLVLPPHFRRGHYRNEALPLYVVNITEVSPPPAGEEPLEWTLLTNEPVSNAADALRVLEWYERRWVVEEFHKVLKTGCQIEDLQFAYVERLQSAIALLSSVALTLLSLRDAGRRPDAQTRQASTLFETEYVETLSIWRTGTIRTSWTISEFLLALARLGGHQNRKHDHPPGWLILWRGWTKLQSMVDGYRAGRHHKCGQT
jgi:hypothetical protein